MTNSIYKFIVLTILAILAATPAQAQTSETDVIEVWLNTRFQNCDSEFADTIYTQVFNKSRLRSLASGDCTGAPKSYSSSCPKEVDELLAPKFADRAVKEGDCEVNPKFNKTGSQNAKSELLDADSVCNSKSNYKFTRQVGSKICRQRYDCEQDFTYLGSTFKAGTYEFTCQADGSDSCDTAAIGTDTCYNPTIQEIGWIKNGDVQKFATPVQGAH